jgi:site-specific DNA recombinase
MRARPALEKGKTVCKGRSIPMDKLANLVTTHMTERLFQP